MPEIGFFLKDLVASIEGNQAYWTIKTLKARDTESKEGRLEGNGWIDFSNFKPSNKEIIYKLNLFPRKLTILMTEALKGWFQAA